MKWNHSITYNVLRLCAGGKTCRIYKLITNHKKYKQMNKLMTKAHLLKNAVMCRFLGKHKYRLLKKFDNNVSKIECVNCKKQFGINHDVRAVLPWDKDLEDMMNICYP